jgi:ribosome-associated protein YbcJ (S4-like RNA binding protein)
LVDEEERRKRKKIRRGERERTYNREKGCV